MSKLTSVYFENFESLYANDTPTVGIPLANRQSGWFVYKGTPNITVNNATGFAIEGDNCIMIMGDTAAVSEIECLFTDPDQGALVTTGYQLSWKYQNASTAYTRVQAKGPSFFVCNSTLNEGPFFVNIYKDDVTVDDNTGSHTGLFNPGLTLHDYRMTQDSLGNIELLVDGVSKHTGTALAVTQPLDRLGIWVAKDATNTGNDKIMGCADVIAVEQSMPSGFNVAKIFVGK